jgi:uncharacterized protein (TIGR02594 family)
LNIVAAAIGCIVLGLHEMFPNAISDFTATLSPTLKLILLAGWGGLVHFFLRQAKKALMAADALQYLDKLAPLPRMVTEARPLLGTLEKPGLANNPTILAWAKELGLEHGYTADSVPWCGLFMALVAHRAGKAPPLNPLWALNWCHFGLPAGQPCLGDVLVFMRNGGGHVGMYVGEDHAGYYRVLGGNQSDKVCVERIAKSRLHDARIPPFNIGMPESRHPIILDGWGRISENEA